MTQKQKQALQWLDASIFVLLVISVITGHLSLVGGALLLVGARWWLWGATVRRQAEAERTIGGLRDEIARLEQYQTEMKEELRAKEDSTRELDRKSYNLYILYHAAKALSSVMDLNELIQLTIDMTSEVMSVESGLIYLVNEEEDVLQLRALKGIEPPPLKHTSLRIGDALAEWATKHVEPFYVKDLRDDSLFVRVFPEALPVFKNLHGTLVIPMFHKDKLVGLMVLGEKLDFQPFSSNDLELIATIAPLAANAIVNAHLYELAILDSTTRLFMVRYFKQRLKEEIKRAKRYYKPLSLIMFDLDNFKEVNDRYGHPQGDVVLQEIGMLIKRGSREDVDLAARYGGEEFAILLPETDSDGAYSVAERVRKSVEAYFFTEHQIRLTISGGVATYPIDAITYTELIDKADMALYQAKRSGRNRICVNLSVSSIGSEFVKGQGMASS